MFFISIDNISSGITRHPRIRNVIPNSLNIVWSDSIKWANTMFFIILIEVYPQRNKENTTHFMRKTSARYMGCGDITWNIQRVSQNIFVLYAYWVDSCRFCHRPTTLASRTNIYLYFYKQLFYILCADGINWDFSRTGVCNTRDNGMWRWLFERGGFRPAETLTEVLYRWASRV